MYVRTDTTTWKISNRKTQHRHTQQHHGNISNHIDTATSHTFQQEIQGNTMATNEKKKKKKTGESRGRQIL